MKNVYGEIAAFYEEVSKDAPIERAFVEGYLRRLAWRGLSDAELREIWTSLEWFMYYLLYADIANVRLFAKEECVSLVYWVHENHPQFRLEEADVLSFLKRLQAFYAYLGKRQKGVDAQLFERAQSAFFQEGKFVLPDFDEEDSVFSELLEDMEELPEEYASQLNELLEKLLNRVGAYYKKPEFTVDFNRAVSLYSGPFNLIPESDGEEFWLGFWDYFLFDYHLVASDITPLAYFCDAERERLTKDERCVLRDLLRAKFTVFYIRRIIDQYLVECVNLFTEEVFELPMPDYGLSDYRKVLFYGHVYAEGIVLLNYITSVPASPRLQKRIREELLQQVRVYGMQQADADIETFFARHAIMVRHTVDILLNLAKVNVFSWKALREHILLPENTAPLDEDVTGQLLTLARKYQISKHALQLLLRMWRDFASVAPQSAAKKTVVAGALFLCFAQINGIHFVRKKNILSRLELTESEFKPFYQKVIHLLQLKPFDPRYLTEEGFILSLYAF